MGYMTVELLGKFLISGAIGLIIIIWIIVLAAAGLHLEEIVEKKFSKLKE